MVDPVDIAPKRSPEGREWITHLVFAGFIFGLFALELLRDFDTRKYGAVMIFVLWAPLLALHELGHALAARLVGWRVLELVVGFGKPLLQFHIRGTRVELRAFPLEGFVLPAPRTLRGAPWKNAFVFFAGPGIEIAFILIAGWSVGFDRLLERSDEIGMVTLQSACVVAALGAVMNLVPFPVSGGLVSDGLGMILSLFSRPEHYAASLALPYVRAAERALADDDLPGARAALAEGLATHPDSPWLRMQDAILRAADGDPKGALGGLEALGAPEDLPEAIRGSWWHARARIALESLDDDLMLDADRCAAAALALAPTDVGRRITCGATLLERMRYHEAARLLGDVAHDALHHLDRDRALSYLALVEWRRERPARAQALLARLRSSDAPARYIARAAREIEAAEAPP